jgi:hypothetical protein
MPTLARRGQEFADSSKWAAVFVSSRLDLLITRASQAQLSTMRTRRFGSVCACGQTELRCSTQIWCFHLRQDALVVKAQCFSQMPGASMS